MLKLQGLAPLAKSVKYKYTDSEIVRKILSAHESGSDMAEDFNEVESLIKNSPPNPDPYVREISHDYSQIKPQKMWDHLLFDLYLANSDKDWVWQDDKAISLLDYLAEFDNKLYFVLVYDKPQNVLLNALEKNVGVVNQDVFHQQLKEWSAYNEALLQFKRNYPDRCLLVNGSYSIKNINSLLKNLPGESNLLSAGSITGFHENKSSSTSLGVNSLVNIYISKNNLAVRTFNELELEADISDALELEENLSITNEDIISTLISQLANKELETLKGTYKDLVAQNTSLINKVRKYEANKAEIDKELRVAKRLNRELDSEKKLLLSTVRKDKDNKNRLNKEINKLNNSIIIQEGVISSLKKQPSEGSNSNIATSDYDYNLLLAQMHLLQEKLEDVYVENLQPNEVNETNRANLESTNPVTLLASPEIIKNDISYRIGSNIIGNYKNPLSIFSLSKMIFAEHKHFEQLVEDDRAKRLNCYKDTEETKKIKSHLSFQIGEAVVEGIESPVKMFVLPVRLASRVFKFKLNYK